MVSAVKRGGVARRWSSGECPGPEGGGGVRAVSAGDGLGGEAGERRQQVVERRLSGPRGGAGGPAVEQRVDERTAEGLPAGALGRRMGEVGVLVQLGQEGGVDPPAR